MVVQMVSAAVPQERAMVDRRRHERDDLMLLQRGRGHGSL
jgi:hypothetical protein